MKKPIRAAICAEDARMTYDLPRPAQGKPRYRKMIHDHARRDALRLLAAHSYETLLSARHG
ncbi:hypothetical protein [Xylella fastidiosa]|uniref:hypothetical protein n=1 Tax=Xylella fastidiosa TaxID=2371 RepID=UPI003AFB72B0